MVQQGAVGRHEKPSLSNHITDLEQFVSELAGAVQEIELRIGVPPHPEPIDGPQAPTPQHALGRLDLLNHAARAVLARLNVVRASM